MKNVKKTAVLLGAGLFSTLMISQSAFAEHYSRGSGRARNEIRQDMREVQKSRTEFRDDVRELQRDRSELRRDRWRDAPASEIARDRAQVRESQREVNQSRQELRRDQAELNRDMDRYGWYRGSDGGWRRDYGWYDNDRWRRDRWERDRDSWWRWW
jgi:Skp family chaperone for outer membrane proteins